MVPKHVGHIKTVDTKSYIIIKRQRDNEHLNLGEKLQHKYKT